MALAVTAFVLVPGTALAAPGKAPEKATVCHRGDSGWELISVSAKAVDAHVRHGDAAPGDPVPGAEGQVFDETCTPQAASRQTWGCYSEAGKPDLYIAALGIEDAIGFFTSTDGSCTGFRGSGTGVRADDSAAADVGCDSLVGRPSALRIADVWTSAPPDAWLCG